MLILVDYDNVDSNITRLGIVHVVNRILSKIDSSEISSNRRVTIRLYGGWYEQNNFTRRAQNLSADISANFPGTSILSDNSTSVIVNCEMAYSILADPTNHLFHTYRSRGVPSGLRVNHPSQCGCTNSSCPLVATYNFVRTKNCSTCNRIKLDDLLYRAEQKLVDTMLTSDLIFSANQPINVAIVSSDDDFWPGIKTSINYGKKVIQIHTRSRLTPTYYTRTTAHNFYVQKQL